MSENNLKSIESKLDIIIKILASNISEGKSQTESILNLSKLGLDRNAIADIVGATPSTVSVRMSEAKKSKKVAKGNL